jgi:hypothetical protein
MKKVENLKKIGFILSIFAVAVLILTGCANKNTQLNTAGARRMPDFGQPERQPDVSGIVKTVTGNEVTILKLEFPGGARGIASTTESGGNSEQKKVSLNLSGGQRMGGGPGMMGGRNSRTQNVDSEAEMLEKMKEMSTGEETIVIPVGVKMLKSDSENNLKQPQMIEANIGDLAVNKMLRVWLDESATDKKVASFVMIAR